MVGSHIHSFGRNIPRSAVVFFTFLRCMHPLRPTAHPVVYTIIRLRSKIYCVINARWYLPGCLHSSCPFFTFLRSSGAFAPFLTRDTAGISSKPHIKTKKVLAPVANTLSFAVFLGVTRASDPPVLSIHCVDHVDRVVFILRLQICNGMVCYVRTNKSPQICFSSESLSC